MVRFLRFSKTLVLAAALGTGFALAAPQAASAGHDHHRGGFWLPLPSLPPPPSFFFPRVVVHRHGPYCGHYGHYDRYERYERPRYDRHERHERWERRRDRHGRW
jgi:hypothetical protein